MRLARLRQKLAGDDGGFTLVELVVTLSVLSIVMVMATSVLILTQQTSKVVGWKAEANTELRRLVDELFAEIETARPAAQCKEPGNPEPVDIVPYTCSRVVDGDGPVLLSAGGNHVCYYSHRVDPAFAGKSVTVDGVEIGGNDTTLYQRVCLVVLDEELFLVQYEPNTGNQTSADPGDLNALPAIGPDRAAKSVRRKLGDVATGTDPAFTYLGRRTDSADSATTALADDADMTTLVPDDDEVSELSPATYGFTDSSVPDAYDVLDSDQLERASRVVFSLRMMTGRGSRRAERELDYRVTLRGARYQSERCWTGDRSVTATTTTIVGNTNPSPAATRTFECAPL